MIEMTLEDVVRVDPHDPAKIVSDHRIVVLREKGGSRRLPLWIGPGEGNAIALQLRDKRTTRPVAADLMAELVRALGGTVEHVTITKYESNMFFAELKLDSQILDARPSDAINLAVRTGAPVFAATAVLDDYGIDDHGVKVEALGSTATVQGPPIEIPPGEWRSLAADLLNTVYPSLR